MAHGTTRIRPGPFRPAPEKTGREREHNPADDHGVAVKDIPLEPRVKGTAIGPGMGPGYDGWNAPWRQ